MLEAYVSAGFPPADFWGLTPRLYLVHMKGARLRLEREQKQDLQQAWVTAALSRSNKMPKLDKLLADPANNASPEGIAAQLAALSAVLPKITMAQWRARRAV